MGRIIFFIFTSLAFLNFAFSDSKSTTHSFYIYDTMNTTSFRSPLFSSLIRHSQYTVDHVSPMGYEVYGDEGLEAFLVNNQVSYGFLSPHDSVRAADYLRGPLTYKNYGQKSQRGHPRYAEVQKTLEQLCRDYNSIMKLSSIGQSVLLRKLWLMKISDGSADEKVEFLYVANIHGDEITGRDLMLRFIEDLGEGYKNGDPDIIDLLSKVDIYVMPSLNPDGAEKISRGNAHGIDMNRNFPDNASGDDNDPKGREPEVQALMGLYKNHQFAVSASFHGGARVVNYPWDNTNANYRFQKWIRKESLNYVELSDDYMKSRQFPKGVTRGWDWYPTYGNMQDWSVFYHDSHHVQIELSDIKWPKYSDMEEFYNLNRNAFLGLIKGAIKAPEFSKPIRFPATLE